MVAYSPMKYCVLLGIVALLTAGPAMGVCSVPQPRLVCAEYFASSVVVEATLVKVRTIRDPEDQTPDAYFYSLHADRVIRGHVAEVFRVYEEINSARADFDWKTERKYLLFLFYSAEDKSWELDGCGNSGPLSEAKAALKEIDTIQAQNGGGVIHGTIDAHGMGAPISGVRVEARGTNGTYAAIASRTGEFQIEVPAGRYAVHAIKKGFSFDTSDFSYENPRHLRIEPGGCVQVQLDLFADGEYHPQHGHAH